MNSRAMNRWLAAGPAVSIAAAFLVWRLALPRHSPTSGMADEPKHQIWLEACRPIAIRQPLEVTGIGENGEKGLYCAPGGGVATDNDGGDAVYRFHVPSAGRYRLWGYCRWLDDSGDGFAVDIGGTQSAIGKTPGMKNWQWLPLTEAQLATGVGRMTLMASGNGFAVRRFFLCNDIALHPLDTKVEPVDIFLDDFDGCEEGEFDSWSRVRGEWTVHRRQDCKSPAAKLLIGKSSSEALINVGAPDWRDYSLMLDCRTLSASPSATAAIRFCCDREGNGLVLRWMPKGADGQVQMELFREEATGVKLLERFTAAWDTSNWSELLVEAGEGAIRISIDATPIRTITLKSPGSGSIGLWLTGEIEMMFDNVQAIGRRARAVPAIGQPLQPRQPTQPAR